MTKLQIARSIVTNVAAITVGTTVCLLIKSNAPATKFTTKVMVMIGAYFLSEMAADRAQHHAGMTFDDLVREVEKLIKKN